MIHAYDEYYLDMAQRKLGSMYEIAVYQEKVTVDEFSERFSKSYIIVISQLSRYRNLAKTSKFQAN